MRNANIKTLPTKFDSSNSELNDAVRERENRNYQFSRQALADDEIQIYVESVTNEIHFRIGSIKRNIFEIGKLIIDVKQLLKQGQFSRWIKNDRQVSMNTANNFMNVYRVCLGTPELVTHFKPSILYKICSPSFPDDLRQELLINAKGVYHHSLKEFLIVVTKFRNGEIGIDSDEVQKLLRQQKNKESGVRYLAELKAIKRDLKNRLKTINKLNQSSIVYPLLKEQDPETDERYLEIEEMIEKFVDKVNFEINMLSHNM